MGEQQFICPECGHIEEAPGECYECGIPLDKPGTEAEPQFDRYDDEFDLAPAENEAVAMDDFDADEVEHGFEGGFRVA
jgi:hypothetical protein